METIENILATHVGDYTLGRLGVSFLIILAALVLRKIFAGVILAGAEKLAKKTATRLDDLIIEAVRRPLEYFIIIAGIGIGVFTLSLPTEPWDLQRMASVALNVLITIDMTWLAFRLIDAFTTYFASMAGRTDTQIDDQLIPLVRKAGKVFVGALAFILLIQNLGYSVSGLLAGLGIGGLAIGLAARDTLANVFGSVAILLDRPFIVGDWIESEGFEGVVEEVGFRSTRIRTFAKSEVSIPNSQLANMTVNNWSRMPRRRIKFVVGITYKTKAEQMEKAVEGIRQIIRDTPEIHDDFFLVNWTDYGASSLDILVYCFTKTVKWAEHLEARQNLMLRIMQMLESMGLEVAFPTRSIYIESSGEEAEKLAEGTKA